MNKISVFVLVLMMIVAINISGQIYVSPDGDDSNSGTIDKPLKSIPLAMSRAYEDSIIYLRGGVYYLNVTIKPPRSGSENKHIRLWAFPGEKPILDFSGQIYNSSSRGFNLSKDYWHFKGLVIRYAGDNGINISGNNNIIENCTLYGNKDTGLQISGGGGNNYVHNCDSYANYDSASHGENADGFAPKLDIGPNNIFRGCRAWNNSDDGWDFYEAQNEVILDSCWTFANGFNIWNDNSYQGDGNGFKVGGNYIPTHHLLTNCLAFENRGKGFDQNHNTAGVTILNCTGVGNKNKNYSFPEKPKVGVDSLLNNLSYNGSVSLELNSIQITNSWNGFLVSNDDFVSLDTSLAKSYRNADSSLPSINLYKLSEGSLLIDAGIDIGFRFMGTAPDIGAFETDYLSSLNDDVTHPSDFKLEQNYPNPFNPATKIRYTAPPNLPKGEALIQIKVYDLLGNEIATLINEFEQPGNYEIQFDAGTLSSGMYFYSLTANGFSSTKKMILLR